MATVLSLAAQVAGSVATQTAVALDDTPFIPGRKVVAVINSGSAAGTAPSYIIEGSNTAADSGYSTLLESVLFGTAVANVKACKWMRFRVATAAGTPGVGLSAYLLGD